MLDTARWSDKAVLGCPGQDVCQLGELAREKGRHRRFEEARALKRSSDIDFDRLLESLQKDAPAHEVNDEDPDYEDAYEDADDDEDDDE